MVARKKTIQCSQLHSGELWHIVSVHDDNHNVDGISVDTVSVHACNHNVDGIFVDT